MFGKGGKWEGEEKKEEIISNISFVFKVKLKKKNKTDYITHEDTKQVWNIHWAQFKNHQDVFKHILMDRQILEHIPEAN